MKLYIKNMVCDRCKTAVRRELEVARIQIIDLVLGEAEVKEPVLVGQLKEFGMAIANLGFELIEDKTARIISQIKSAVVEFVHATRTPKAVKFSTFITDKIHREYSSISNLFSEVEGITIERYLILQKTERIKELLVYDELSIKEISGQLGYSSVQHLSNQFKKETGLTPAHFRKVGNVKRTTLDRV